MRAANLGDMSHLPAGPGDALAVDVNGGSTHAQPSPVIVDLVTDQVGHGDGSVSNGLAERPAGDGADVLFELRDRGAVQRPVSGIMHPRGDLVDQDLWP